MVDFFFFQKNRSKRQLIEGRENPNEGPEYAERQVWVLRESTPEMDARIHLASQEREISVNEEFQSS